MDRITDLIYVVLEVLGRKIALFSDGTILPMVHGAEGETDEFAVPDDLGEMDEATARDLHTKLQAKFDEKRKDATTKESMDELRQIRATQARLAERVTAVQAEAAEIAKGLEEVDAPSTLPEAAPVIDPAATPAPVVDPVAPALAPVAQAASTTAPVTAGITPPNISEGANPAAVVAAVTPARPRVAYRAAAGQTEIQAGTEVDYEAIGRMLDSARGLDGSKGWVEAHVAALPAYEDMAEFKPFALSRNMGVQAVDTMIREAVQDFRFRTGRMTDGEKARLGKTAAICDPLDIIREIPDCSIDADPLGDSLPSRPAGRLGFQFTQAISLSSVSAGVSGWSDTQQTFVTTTPSTWKPCVDIDCPTPQSIRAEEIVACARFDVTTEMSNPERVQDVLSKMAALRTRIRTQNLLAKIDALSSAYTFTSQYAHGAFPALIEAAMSVVARAIYAERIDPGDYQIYLPPGLVESLVTDRQGRSFNAGDTAADAEAIADVIAMVEKITGMRTIRLWDVVGSNPFAALNAPGGGAVALPDLGCAVTPFTVRFIAPEAALYFSTGEEKTGLESSPELLRQNKVQFFSREWVGLAKHGCHPWFSTLMTLNPNGSRAGATTPVAC